MKKISLLVVGVSLCFGHQALAVDFVRKNASTPEGQADVQALNVALKKMRELGCADPTSWYYQGAIHALPDKVENNTLCPQYVSYQTDLLTAWNNCTHDQAQIGQISPVEKLHFLLWHRLYISYFEKIVRKYSGKADFALPYWDYTDTNYRVMPALLRDKGTSLYEAARLPALNEGYAVGKAPSEDPKKRSEVDQALNLSDLMETRTFDVFSNNINNAPHGFMHDYIGGGFDDYEVYNPIYQKTMDGGLMSWVPSAGFDPVFWMHHAQIDRIWESWSYSEYGKKAPEKELINTPWPYVFFDGDGKKHSYTVAEAYKAAYNVNYAYDNLISVSTQSKDASHLAQSKPMPIPASKALKMVPVWTKSFNASSEQSELVLKPAALDRKSSKRLLIEAEPKSIVMQIDVSFDAKPNDFYLVYIKYPDGRLDKAGVMTFFGADHHADQHAGHTMKDGDMDKMMYTSFVYDVTDELEGNEDYDIVIKSGNGSVVNIAVDKVSLFKYE